ncbi:MAG: retropepsin-like aspartic protease, partial [Microcoleaceae cyanobacterium]
MLKTNLINTLALLPIIGLIIHPQVSLSQNKPNTTPKINQTISQNSSEKALGQQLLQELIQCLGNKIPNAQQPTQAELEAVSMQCSMEVIILTPNGTIRPDFHDRMKALITVTGMDIPKTASTGKGQVQISQVPNSLLFTVPVNVAGEKYDFILDTGASNSIINQPLATKLNLTGVKIPGELLEYFVVGNNCDDMEATLHSLPPVKVDQATVTGLNGMGLPASFIPTNIPGVLGMDFLKSFDLVVNPDQDKLE